MNWRLMIPLLPLFFLQIPKCNAQNTLSFGAKFGLGATVIPAHPEFQSRNRKYAVQTNPSILHGVMVQYLIGKLAGIETGFQVLYHSYSVRDGDSYLYNFFTTGPAIVIIDYQIPILLMYNFEHRFNVMRNFKIVAGTSVDWLNTHFFMASGRLRSLYNTIVGFRIVTDKQTSRVEYSFEHQYSFKRAALTGLNYDQTEDTIETRISSLTVSITWFFAVKERR